MSYPRLSAFVLAIGAAFATADSASAAWNNVFQVCCNDCNKPRASYSSPCPQPCPAALPAAGNANQLRAALLLSAGHGVSNT